MTKLSRASLVLVLSASVAIGTSACTQPNAGNVAKSGGSSGPGGGGAGGSSQNGGSGGSSAGGSGGSSVGGAGGSSGGSGGSSRGGAGGASAGGGGGAGGSSVGGSAGGVAGASAGGAGGGSGGARNGGAGGAGGAAGGASGAGGGAGGTQNDAGLDARRDVGVDRPSDALRDTVAVPDAPPVDDGGSCPSGQSACGTSCYNLQTDTSHCGGCTAVCGSGQTCNAGACTEGGSAGATDGCTSDLARNLTLSQIAVYQSVKIPIMQAGSEVAAAARNADVVAARNTMFRAFVTVGSGWTARELSARLTITPSGGSPTQYYAKKTIGASSTESDLTTSFQMFVPPAGLGGAATYSVEIVECTTQSGTAGAARFPTSGDLDLGVKSTGGLKVTIIPLSFGGLLPDTSATALAGYADYMMAMYPINNISISVGDTLTAATPIDWEIMLTDVESKRADDSPAADVYYFGLVKPADTLRTYCNSSCTTGIGYVVTQTSAWAAASRAAVGVGFADSTSRETMAHEIGHNHGREHAPCVTGGTIASPDPSYPYSGGLIGSWGYDARTQKLFDPAKYSDIMGYCNNKWISDYTYEGITTRVAKVNGLAMVYTPDYALSTWRSLLVSASGGARWGTPIRTPTPAAGDAEPATIYDGTGEALTSVVVYRAAIADTGSSRVMVPEPQPGWYAVAVAGAPVMLF